MVTRSSGVRRSSGVAVVAVLFVSFGAACSSVGPPLGLGPDVEDTAVSGDVSSGSDATDVVAPVDIVVSPDAGLPDVHADVPEPEDTTQPVPDAADTQDTGGGDVADDTTQAGPVDPLFLEGCPVPGQATARVIEDPAATMIGPSALGGVGDYLLMNERAAFIVTGAEDVKTYYYYGGIPVDAVAVEGCAQAGPERFDEVPLLLGYPVPSDLPQSVLRGFRGEWVEVVADGSDGGEARVRVHGTDDLFWLVEYELVKRVFQAGMVRPVSTPLGVDVAVDYVLEPDSRVLRIEVHVQNQLDELRPVLSGLAVFFGHTTTPTHFADSQLSVEGFNLDVGLPWLVASSGDGAWALAVDDGEIGTTNLSGVDALLDITALFSPKLMEPHGEEGDEAVFTFFLAVGDRDVNSAVSELQAVNPDGIRATDYGLVEVEGKVHDEEGPVEGASVDLEIENQQGKWRALTSFVTDAEGWFGGLIPDMPVDFRVVTRAEGRNNAEPFIFQPKTADALDVTIGAAGELAYDIRDTYGASLPARIVLWQGDSEVQWIYAAGAPGTRLVPPGSYDVTVTRGFEYGTWDGSVDVVPGTPAKLTVVLERLVDTSGFLSTDTHLHATPSPDSSVPIDVRIISAAAEGLEVPVATDHEHIVGWGDGVVQTGLGAWVHTIIGEEVTASIPEHTNMYPVVPDPPEVAPRGGPVKWFGLDIDQIYQAERDRGGQVVQLNHARNGCNYMCLIGYDRLTGEPTLDDPTKIGLPEGASLWSWDLDAFEYQNGNEPVFLDPNDPEGSGTFDDWMSFLNLGHRVTALGVTDAHGYAVGSPRSYFVSPTDSPDELDEADMVAAIKQGRVVVSTGAFARVLVDDVAGLGDTVTDVDGAVDVAVHIEALPEIDVTRFKVFVNCDEALTVQTTDPDAVVKYDGTVSIPVTTDAHVVVLGLGDEPLPRGLYGFDPVGVPRFTTNAIYVDADGDGQFTAPGGKGCAYTP